MNWLSPLLQRAVRPMGLATMTLLAATGTSSGQEVKIGVPLSLSGPVAFAGTKMKDAMDLAFDEINSSNYLGTMRLVPVYADDRSSQPQGISVTQQLALRDRVSAIVGYTASNICQAALPVAQELNVPTLQADCVVPGLNKIGDDVYSAVRPSDQFVEELIAKIVPERKIKTAAVLYQRENPVFSNLQGVVARAFEKQGVKMVGSEAVTSGAEADFSAQLTSIAAAKPDVLVILLLGGQVGPAMVQARQAGLETTTFLGEQNFDSVDVRRVAGKDAEGAVFPSHWFAGSPLPQNQRFVTSYRQRFHRDVDTFSANGYNAVWMIAQVVKRAGSGDRDAIRKALAAPEEFDTIFGTSGKMKFVDRQVSLTPFFFTVGKDDTVLPLK